MNTVLVGVSYVSFNFFRTSDYRYESSLISMDNLPPFENHINNYTISFRGTSKEFVGIYILSIYSINQNKVFARDL